MGGSGGNSFSLQPASPSLLYAFFSSAGERCSLLHDGLRLASLALLRVAPRDLSLLLLRLLDLDITGSLGDLDFDLLLEISAPSLLLGPGAR